MREEKKKEKIYFSKAVRWFAICIHERDKTPPP